MTVVVLVSVLAILGLGGLAGAAACLSAQRKLNLSVQQTAMTVPAERRSEESARAL